MKASIKKRSAVKTVARAFDDNVLGTTVAGVFTPNATSLFLFVKKVGRNYYFEAPADIIADKSLPNNVPLRYISIGADNALLNDVNIVPMLRTHEYLQDGGDPAKLYIELSISDADAVIYLSRLFGVRKDFSLLHVATATADTVTFTGTDGARLQPVAMTIDGESGWGGNNKRYPIPQIDLIMKMGVKSINVTADTVTVTINHPTYHAETAYILDDAGVKYELVTARGLLKTGTHDIVYTSTDATLLAYVTALVTAASTADVHGAKFVPLKMLFEKKVHSTVANGIMTVTWTGVLAEAELYPVCLCVPYTATKVISHLDDNSLLRADTCQMSFSGITLPTTAASSISAHSHLNTRQGNLTLSLIGEGVTDFVLAPTAVTSTSKEMNAGNVTRFMHNLRANLALFPDVDLVVDGDVHRVNLPIHYDFDVDTNTITEPEKWLWCFRGARKYADGIAKNKAVDACNLVYIDGIKQGDKYKFVLVNSDDGFDYVRGATYKVTLGYYDTLGAYNTFEFTGINTVDKNDGANEAASGSFAIIKDTPEEFGNPDLVLDSATNALDKAKVYVLDIVRVYNPIKLEGYIGEYADGVLTPNESFTKLTYFGQTPGRVYYEQPTTFVYPSVSTLSVIATVVTIDGTSSGTHGRVLDGKLVKGSELAAIGGDANKSYLQVELPSTGHVGSLFWQICGLTDSEQGSLFLCGAGTLQGDGTTSRYTHPQTNVTSIVNPSAIDYRPYARVSNFAYGHLSTETGRVSLLSIDVTPTSVTFNVRNQFRSLEDYEIVIDTVVYPLTKLTLNTVAGTEIQLQSTAPEVLAKIANDVVGGLKEPIGGSTVSAIIVDIRVKYSNATVGLTSRYPVNGFMSLSFTNDMPSLHRDSFYTHDFTEYLPYIDDNLQGNIQPQTFQMAGLTDPTNLELPMVVSNDRDAKATSLGMRFPRTLSGMSGGSYSLSRGNKPLMPMGVNLIDDFQRESFVENLQGYTDYPNISTSAGEYIVMVPVHFNYGLGSSSMPPMHWLMEYQQQFGASPVIAVNPTGPFSGGTSDYSGVTAYGNDTHSWWAVKAPDGVTLPYKWGSTYTIKLSLELTNGTDKEVTIRGVNGNHPTSPSDTNNEGNYLCLTTSNPSQDISWPDIIQKSGTVPTEASLLRIRVVSIDEFIAPPRVKAYVGEKTATGFEPRVRDDGHLTHLGNDGTYDWFEVDPSAYAKFGASYQMVMVTMLADGTIGDLKYEAGGGVVPETLNPDPTKLYASFLLKWLKEGSLYMLSVGHNDTNKFHSLFISNNSDKEGTRCPCITSKTNKLLPIHPDSFDIKQHQGYTVYGGYGRGDVSRSVYVGIIAYNFNNLKCSFEFSSPYRGNESYTIAFDGWLYELEKDTPDTTATHEYTLSTYDPTLCAALVKLAKESDQGNTTEFELEFRINFGSNTLIGLTNIDNNLKGSTLTIPFTCTKEFPYLDLNSFGNREMCMLTFNGDDFTFVNDRDIRGVAPTVKFPHTAQVFKFEKSLFANHPNGYCKLPTADVAAFKAAAVKELSLLPPAPHISNSPYVPLTIDYGKSITLANPPKWLWAHHMGYGMGKTIASNLDDGAPCHLFSISCWEREPGMNVFQLSRDFDATVDFPWVGGKQYKVTYAVCDGKGGYVNHEFIGENVTTAWAGSTFDAKTSFTIVKATPEEFGNPDLVMRLDAGTSITNTKIYIVSIEEHIIPGDFKVDLYKVFDEAGKLVALRKRDEDAVDYVKAFHVTNQKDLPANLRHFYVGRNKLDNRNVLSIIYHCNGRYVYEYQSTVYLFKDYGDASVQMERGTYLVDEKFDKTTNKLDGLISDVNNQNIDGIVERLFIAAEATQADFITVSMGELDRTYADGTSYHTRANVYGYVGTNSIINEHYAELSNDLSRCNVIKTEIARKSNLDAGLGYTSVRATGLGGAGSHSFSSWGLPIGTIPDGEYQLLNDVGFVFDPRCCYTHEERTLYNNSIVEYGDRATKLNYVPYGIESLFAKDPRPFTEHNDGVIYRPLPFRMNITGVTQAQIDAIPDDVICEDVDDKTKPFEWVNRGLHVNTDAVCQSSAIFMSLHDDDYAAPDSLIRFSNGIYLLSDNVVMKVGSVELRSIPGSNGVLTPESAIMYRAICAKFVNERDTMSNASIKFTIMNYGSENNDPNDVAYNATSMAYPTYRASDRKDMNQVGFGGANFNKGFDVTDDYGQLEDDCYFRCTTREFIALDNQPVHFKGWALTPTGPERIDFVADQSIFPVGTPVKEKRLGATITPELAATDPKIAEWRRVHHLMRDNNVIMCAEQNGTLTGGFIKPHDLILFEYDYANESVALNASPEFIKQEGRAYIVKPGVTLLNAHQFGRGMSQHYALHPYLTVLPDGNSSWNQYASRQDDIEEAVLVDNKEISLPNVMSVVSVPYGSSDQITYSGLIETVESDHMLYTHDILPPYIYGSKIPKTANCIVSIELHTRKVVVNTSLFGVYEFSVPGCLDTIRVNIGTDGSFTITEQNLMTRIMHYLEFGKRSIKGHVFFGCVFTRCMPRTQVQMELKDKTNPALGWKTVDNTSSLLLESGEIIYSLDVTPTNLVLTTANITHYLDCEAIAVGSANGGVSERIARIGDGIYTVVDPTYCKAVCDYLAALVLDNDKGNVVIEFGPDLNADPTIFDITVYPIKDDKGVVQGLSTRLASEHTMLARIKKPDTFVSIQYEEIYFGINLASGQYMYHVQGSGGTTNMTIAPIIISQDNYRFRTVNSHYIRPHGTVYEETPVWSNRSTDDIKGLFDSLVRELGTAESLRIRLRMDDVCFTDLGVSHGHNWDTTGLHTNMWHSKYLCTLDAATGDVDIDHDVEVSGTSLDYRSLVFTRMWGRTAQGSAGWVVKAYTTQADIDSGSTSKTRNIKVHGNLKDLNTYELQCLFGDAVIKYNHRESKLDYQTTIGCMIDFGNSHNHPTSELMDAPECYFELDKYSWKELGERNQAVFDTIDADVVFPQWVSNTHTKYSSTRYIAALDNSSQQNLLMLDLWVDVNNAEEFNIFLHRSYNVTAKLEITIGKHVFHPTVQSSPGNYHDGFYGFDGDEKELLRNILIKGREEALAAGHTSVAIKYLPTGYGLLEKDDVGDINDPAYQTVASTYPGVYRDQAAWQVGLSTTNMDSPHYFVVREYKGVITPSFFHQTDENLRGYIVPDYLIKGWYLDIDGIFKRINYDLLKSKVPQAGTVGVITTPGYTAAQWESDATANEKEFYQVAKSMILPCRFDYLGSDGYFMGSEFNAPDLLAFEYNPSTNVFSNQADYISNLAVAGGKLTAQVKSGYNPTGKLVADGVTSTHKWANNEGVWSADAHATMLPGGVKPNKAVCYLTVPMGDAEGIVAALLTENIIGNGIIEYTATDQTNSGIRKIVAGLQDMVITTGSPSASFKVRVPGACTSINITTDANGVFTLSEQDNLTKARRFLDFGKRTTDGLVPFAMQMYAPYGNVRLFFTKSPMDDAIQFGLINNPSITHDAGNFNVIKCFPELAAAKPYLFNGLKQGDTPQYVSFSNIFAQVPPTDETMRPLVLSSTALMMLNGEFTLGYDKGAKTLNFVRNDRHSQRDCPSVTCTSSFEDQQAFFTYVRSVWNSGLRDEVADTQSYINVDFRIIPETFKEAEGLTHTHGKIWSPQLRLYPVAEHSFDLWTNITEKYIVASDNGWKFYVNEDKGNWEINKVYRITLTRYHPATKSYVSKVVMIDFSKLASPKPGQYHYPFKDYEESKFFNVNYCDYTCRFDIKLEEIYGNITVPFKMNYGSPRLGLAPFAIGGPASPRMSLTSGLVATDDQVLFNADIEPDIAAMFNRWSEGSSRSATQILATRSSSLLVEPLTISYLKADGTEVTCTINAKSDGFGQMHGHTFNTGDNTALNARLQEIWDSGLRSGLFTEYAEIEFKVSKFSAGILPTTTHIQANINGSFELQDINAYVGHGQHSTTAVPIRFYITETVDGAAGMCLKLNASSFNALGTPKYLDRKKSYLITFTRLNCNTGERESKTLKLDKNQCILDGVEGDEYTKYLFPIQGSDTWTDAERLFFDARESNEVYASQIQFKVEVAVFDSGVENHIGTTEENVVVINGPKCTLDAYSVVNNRLTFDFTTSLDLELYNKVSLVKDDVTGLHNKVYGNSDFDIELLTGAPGANEYRFTEKVGNTVWNFTTGRFVLSLVPVHSDNTMWFPCRDNGDEVNFKFDPEVVETQSTLSHTPALQTGVHYVPHGYNEEHYRENFASHNIAFVDLTVDGLAIGVDYPSEGLGMVCLDSVLTLQLPSGRNVSQTADLAESTAAAQTRYVFKDAALVAEYKTVFNAQPRFNPKQYVEIPHVMVPIKFTLDAGNYQVMFTNNALPGEWVSKTPVVVGLGTLSANNMETSTGVGITIEKISVTQQRVKLYAKNARAYNKAISLALPSGVVTLGAPKIEIVNGVIFNCYTVSDATFATEMFLNISTGYANANNERLGTFGLKLSNADVLMTREYAAISSHGIATNSDVSVDCGIWEASGKRTTHYTRIETRYNQASDDYTLTITQATPFVEGKIFTLGAERITSTGEVVMGELEVPITGLAIPEVLVVTKTMRGWGDLFEVFFMN